MFRGRRRSRGGRRRRGTNTTRVVHPTPQPDTALVIERLSFLDNITGTGAFNPTRRRINAFTIPELATIAPLYTEYRFSFLRFILVPEGSSSALGTIFISYDFDGTVTAPPATYPLAVSTENILVSSPSNSQTATLTHRIAFQREVFGSGVNVITIPRSEQTQRWLLVGSTLSNAQDFCQLNSGSNLLQSGVVGANIFVAYRCVFRGARAV